MSSNIKKIIILKLIRSNIWGGKHTPLDYAIKGIPEHTRNTQKGNREIKKTIKELINENWVHMMMKRTGKGYDHHISLNPKKIKEIKQFITNS